MFTTTTLVRVTDDGGTSGIGAYDSDTFGAWDLAPLETLRTIAPRLIGVDADDREGVSATLTEDGTSPFPPAVRSTIDVALWDLAARRRDRPLREVLAKRGGGLGVALVRVGAIARRRGRVPRGGRRSGRRPDSAP